MLITVRTCGHRYLTAIKFVDVLRRSNDRTAVDAVRSTEALLTSIVRVWQPERGGHDLLDEGLVSEWTGVTL